MIEYLWQFLDIVGFFGKLVCVVTFACVYVYHNNKVLIISSFILLPAFFVGVDVANFGLPHHWSTASLLGKLVISYVIGLMSLTSVLFFSFVLSDELVNLYKVIISSSVGISVMYLAPGFELILICLFVGDCL